MSTLTEVRTDRREGHEVPLHGHLLTALGEHLLKDTRIGAGEKIMNIPFEHAGNGRKLKAEERRAQTDHNMESSEVSWSISSTLSTILVWNWIMFITLAKSE